MSERDHTKPSGVKRIVFKEIVGGDWRKFVAQSNDADSGGGARDLRFRPYDEFAKIFRLLFPSVRHARRRRGGTSVQVEVFVGEFYWHLDGEEGSREATFEPPTDARGGEGRIPVVHKYPPFTQPPPSNEGRVVLLLIQRGDNRVWPAFATERSLRANEWDAAVTQVILGALDAHRPAKQVARGYIDFESGRRYSDA
jgi:hypothetical protein